MNFTRHEFRCKCGECGLDTVDYELMELLEDIRLFFNAPVHVTSGVRCPKYNEKVGGSSLSQHMYGRAADIVVDGVEPEKVADLAVRLGAGGVGRYSHFTHVDTRSSIARWGRNA